MQALTLHADVGPNRANSGRNRPTLDDFGSDLADMGPGPVEIGQIAPQLCAHLDRTRPNLGRAWPSLGCGSASIGAGWPELGPDSTNIGTLWTNVGPNSTTVGPILNNFDQSWPGFWPTLARFRPTLGHPGGGGGGTRIILER